MSHVSPPVPSATPAPRRRPDEEDRTPEEGENDRDDPGDHPFTDARETQSSVHSGEPTSCQSSFRPGGVDLRPAAPVLGEPPLDDGPRRTLGEYAPVRPTAIRPRVWGRAAPP
jgi:hypothetical protein